MPPSCQETGSLTTGTYRGEGRDYTAHGVTNNLLVYTSSRNVRLSLFWGGGLTVAVVVPPVVAVVEQCSYCSGSRVVYTGISSSRSSSSSGGGGGFDPTNGITTRIIVCYCHVITQPIWICHLDWPPPCTKISMHYCETSMSMPPCTEISMHHCEATVVCFCQQSSLDEPRRPVYSHGVAQKYYGNDNQTDV